MNVMYRNWTLLICSVLLGGCGGLQPNTAPEPSVAEGVVDAGTKPSRESILTLVEVCGTSETMQATFDQMKLILKSNFQKKFKSKKKQEMLERYWQSFESQYNAASLIDEIVPIYQKYFDQKTVNELIVFYQSPTGKRIVAATPAITKESMQVGLIWAQKMTKATIADLKARAKKDADAEKNSNDDEASEGGNLPKESRENQ